MGVDHPMSRTGRYSRAMPEKLIVRFNEAMLDPGLLDLSPDLALLDTRVEQLLERLDVPDIWGMLGSIRAAHRVLARPESTPTQRARATEQIGTALETLRDDTRDWTKIAELLEQRRKIAESERRRRVDAETTMTIEELVNVASSLANIALDYIPPGESRERYIADVGRVFNVERKGDVSQSVS